MRSGIPLRWVVMGVFVISSSLNYLDRQILATLAPVLSAEFHLSNRDYGLILSAFSVVYMLSSPLAGLFIDRVGLNRGISLSVALWSLAGIGTGLARGFGGLLWCRAALGMAEAGGVPATGKAIRHYLQPNERAMGNALSQIGLSAGAMAAPVIATWLAVGYGWRSAFVVTGIAGFLWIPLWNWTARRAPAAGERAGSREKYSPRTLLRDRRLWAIVAANVLGMTAYTLWTNWTTIYLVRVHELSLVEAAWFAWIPPLAFNCGGLTGGWLSMRAINTGMEPAQARRRICMISCFALLLTAAVPLTPTALLATAAISFSAFFSSAFSVNLYTMPLDTFDARNSAFAISLLTAAYGFMQAVFSPAAGAMIDRYGFQPVCLAVSVAPMGALAVLWMMGTGPKAEAARHE